ncbi:hypothetical protein AAVH_37032 [Aphelenchoides avenae]|nr:hypothetical protein AAVH_37032 [Aphelenchus avenae]
MPNILSKEASPPKQLEEAAGQDGACDLIQMSDCTSVCQKHCCETPVQGEPPEKARERRQKCQTSCMDACQKQAGKTIL